MSTERKGFKEKMKRIDFEHGSIPSNILNAAIPMLVAQLLSLLYNIIDRIYIARIPHIGTTALGAVGLCFPIIVIITAFSNLFYDGLRRRNCFNGHWIFVCAPDPASVRRFRVCSGLCIPVPDDLSARHTSVHDLHRYEFVYQRAGICHDRHDIRCHRRGGKLHSRSGFHLRLFAWNPGCCNCNRDFPDTLRCICPLFSEKTIGA